MADLNPVSDSHALLEAMLQKLRLNTQTNSSAITDMETSSPGECNPEPVEDSSKTKIYQFGLSSNSKEQEGCSSVWSKWGNPLTQQSSHFGGALTPLGNQPVKRISKHNSRFSAKPKRPPLMWGRTDVPSWVGNDQMLRPEKQFSLEGLTSSDAAPSYRTESIRNPPDLLAPTLTTSPSVQERTEVRAQSGTWSWGLGNEINKGTRFQEQSEKTTRTSRKKWGEAKRWAQNVKERWREKHRSTQTRQKDEGHTQARNVQSNHSSLWGPTDVNNTPTAVAETPNIHHEVINMALEEAEGPGSPNYNSDSPFSFGTTSNLMEEIFSGTEWAQFLSVNCNTQDQSNNPPNGINQSREEEWNGKWTHQDATDSHSDITQPSFLHMTSDKPIYNQSETSQMSVPASHVTDLSPNPSHTFNPFTNQQHNTNPNLNKPHNSEQSNVQSQPSQLYPNESKATEQSNPQLMSVQASDPGQGRTEDFIPLLDRSYIKPTDRSSLKSHGSLSRKREHPTKKRDSFKQTTQDMEDKEHSSSFMATQSANSVRSASPTSSIKSLMDSISEVSASSVSSETAVKKRRMEDTRRVRFAEEAIILPTSYLPEYNSDDDDDDDDDGDEEEKVEENDNNVWTEEPSPRPSFPKWIVSLKGRSAKYKF